jgi:hypothetical protein
MPNSAARGPDEPHTCKITTINTEGANLNMALTTTTTSTTA